MDINQLLSYYHQTIQNFHAEQKAPASDCALAVLLNGNKEEILKNVTIDFKHHSPEYNFHKHFRRDALTNSTDEQAIWFLLQDAPVFWQVFKAKAVLTPEKNKTREDYKAMG